MGGGDRTADPNVSPKSKKTTAMAFGIGSPDHAALFCSPRYVRKFLDASEIYRLSDMPQLLQGLIRQFGENARLLSSIRPVMTTRPAPSALMVNPQAETQSRVTSSRLDAPSGFSRLRFARFRHHKLKDSSHPRQPLDRPVFEVLPSITLPVALTPRYRRRRTSKQPIQYALFCWRAQRRQHLPGVYHAGEPAMSMNGRASALRNARHG